MGTEEVKMSYIKIDPIQVIDEFPPSLRKQIRDFNNLLIQDEFHRTADLSDDEILKFIVARSKLLKAKGALLDACVEHYESNVQKKKQEFWRGVVKGILSVGASLAYLIYQLVNLGWGPFPIALMGAGAALVSVLFIYWLNRN